MTEENKYVSAYLNKYWQTMKALLDCLNEDDKEFPLAQYYVKDGHMKEWYTAIDVARQLMKQHGKPDA